MKQPLFRPAARAGAVAFALSLVLAHPAFAQLIGGGGGGGSLGLFAPVWTYFQQNFAEALILGGVVTIGIYMIFHRFRVEQVILTCVGLVIVANAVAIAAGAVSLGG